MHAVVFIDRLEQSGLRETTRSAAGDEWKSALLVASRADLVVRIVVSRSADVCVPPKAALPRLGQSPVCYMACTPTVGQGAAV